MESVLKDRRTFTLAITYNILPWETAKYEDEHIEDEFRWCLLAKRKYACNVLVKYNSDELEYP